MTLSLVAFDISRTCEFSLFFLLNVESISGMVGAVQALVPVCSVDFLTLVPAVVTVHFIVQ